MESLVVVVSLTLTLVFIWILLSRPDPKKVPSLHLSPAVREMAADPARRSEAVEWWRRETGASRADALLAVELVAAEPLSNDVKAIAADPGRKIEAIKRVRDEAGVSLMAAKMVVEKYLANQGSTTS